MPTKTTLDLDKPIRKISGNKAHYVGITKEGSHLVQTLLGTGRWTAAVEWDDDELEHTFENVPDEPTPKPKLIGFLEVYSNSHDFGRRVMLGLEDNIGQEVTSLDDENYWLTIDLAKVPDEAIVKVAP